MNTDPCSVCGGTDVNLVDGYYYCVECGTQDVNVQETVVEHTVLADGTFAHTASKRFTTVIKDGIEMSGEWCKWHAFNFILAGLTDELMAVGAKPSVKMKVLWVWSRYMKKFQVQEDLRRTSEFHDDSDELNKTKIPIDKENKDSEYISDAEEESGKRKPKNKNDNIRIVTKALLLAILYVALNLDESEIQLSDLRRYIREGRISISTCQKFAPNEINKKIIPHWHSFIRCTKESNDNFIRKLAMILFTSLNLGTPIVPNIRKIIDNYIAELCLPRAFKNLVISLLDFVPCDSVLKRKFINKNNVVQLPDFEGAAMSYILIAMKICFGLDDDYEVKLSDVVDKINNEENYLKCFKFGMFLEDTDRLFSFRDWCDYLTLRKIILCQYYLPMAQQHDINVGDSILMEHLGERYKRKVDLSDEITMDTLNKIPLNNDVNIIPKAEFVSTLRPSSTYTEVILRHSQDSELKLLLSEDFTQYSIEYACEHLRLIIEEENVVVGISELNKTVNPKVVGTLECKTSDFSIVYIRNCENKNWLKTNPPSVEHITTIDNDQQYDNDDNLNESDHDCSFRKETTSQENDVNIIEESDNVNQTNEEVDIKKLLIMDEEIEDISIFDDTFEDIDECEKEEVIDPEIATDDFQDSKSDLTDSQQDRHHTLAKFDPDTFDRERTIKELVLLACKKYKIPIPSKYTTKSPTQPRKRKSSFIDTTTGVSQSKKPKNFSRRNAMKETERLKQIYYSHLQSDGLHKIAEQIKVACQNFKVDEFNAKMSLIDETNYIDNINTNQTIRESREAQTPADNVDTIENIDVQIENKSCESEEDDVDYLKQRYDPKFDEKIYNIKQLYVKFKNSVEEEDILDFDDLELNDVIDKKLSEHNKQSKANEIEKNETKENVSSGNDTDDDISQQSRIKEENILLQKLEQKNEKLQPLLNTANGIPCFKYWLRHYFVSAFTKASIMKLKFNLELQNNLPSSFNFVINECAALLDCSAFSLYKNLQMLEQIMFHTGKSERQNQNVSSRKKQLKVTSRGK